MATCLRPCPPNRKTPRVFKPVDVARIYGYAIRTYTERQVLCALCKETVIGENLDALADHYEEIKGAADAFRGALDEVGLSDPDSARDSIADVIGGLDSLFNRLNRFWIIRRLIKQLVVLQYAGRVLESLLEAIDLLQVIEAALPDIEAIINNTRCENGNNRKTSTDQEESEHSQA